MREEIRLGNEALSRGDLQEASRHFQELLARGGTALEERIATNRLKEIERLQKGEEKGKGKKERAASPKPAKEKGSKARKKEKDKDEEVEESTRLLLNLKDPLLVKIKRY